MSKKEGSIDDLDNVVSHPFFSLPTSNTEEVPYLNNDSDLVQDVLSEAEKNTIELQMKFMAKNSIDDSNLLNVDFCRKL
jgi:hypothetical protein